MTDLDLQNEYLLTQTGQSRPNAFAWWRGRGVATLAAVAAAAFLALMLKAEHGSRLYELRSSLLASCLKVEHGALDWVVWHFEQYGGDTHGLLLAIGLVAGTAILAIRVFDRVTA